LLGGTARLVGAASWGRTTAGDVGIVQRPGLVSAGKRIKEWVAIVCSGTVRRRSRAIAVDRMLQLVPRGVRDVPDGRDELCGGDSRPREGGEGSGQLDIQPPGWGAICESNLWVEISWRRTGLERWRRGREVACGAAPDGGRVRGEGGGERRVGGGGGENGGPRSSWVRRARRGGRKGRRAWHGVGAARRYCRSGDGLEFVGHVA